MKSLQVGLDAALQRVRDQQMGNLGLRSDLGNLGLRSDLAREGPQGPAQPPLVSQVLNTGIDLRFKGFPGSRVQPCINISLSAFRILPPQSLWRRLIEILKRRGASRFFQKRQQQVIADMRISFDKILESAVESQQIDQTAQETIAQLVKSVDTVMKSVLKLQSQLDGVEKHVLRQEKTLNDLRYHLFDHLPCFAVMYQSSPPCLKGHL
jgi:hypothetical protein